jgi:predicted DNA-binding transcriptional regulator AlpA
MLHTTGLAEPPTTRPPTHLTPKMIGELVGLRRTATEILLAGPSAPAPIQPGARPRRWRWTEVRNWLLSLQDTPAEGLESFELITFNEVADRLALRRTATRTLLAAPGAPSPVRLNKRAVRYWAAEVAAWDPIAAVAAPPPAPVRPAGGRPRRSNI